MITQSLPIHSLPHKHAHTAMRASSAQASNAFRMHAERESASEYANLMNDLDILYTSQISIISGAVAKSDKRIAHMLQESRMLTPATASRSFNRQLYTNLSLS